MGRALFAGSNLTGVLYVLAYGLWMYSVAVRSGLFGSRETAGTVTVQDPWKPRQVLVAWLLPVPLLLTGVLPYLVTSFTEPAATAQADLLERMPQLAPGQGMIQANIPGRN